MAHRHDVHHAKHGKHHHGKHHARGGEVFYAGGESNVAKEADERKHGGKIKRAHDGSVHTKVKKHSMHHMRAEGGHPKHRLDKFRRGGRAKGGRTGADHHPLSSAHKIHHIADHEGGLSD